MLTAANSSAEQTLMTFSNISVAFSPIKGRLQVKTSIKLGSLVIGYGVVRMQALKDSKDEAPSTIVS
jgi:hypothetical protein